VRPIRVEEHRVASFDATDIAYHVTGQGLPVLLGNGLGGSWRAWQHQIGYLDGRYRFISWDYRGLYRSGPPPSLDALRVEDHVRDALAVLDAEKIERTAVIGWSMGVQIAIELFRAAPERVAALVLVNGVAGKPYDTVLDTRALRHVLPRTIRTLGRISPVVEAVTRQLVRSPETVVWAKRVGLASSTLDEDLFRELAGSFEDLDMEVYMRTLELIGEHDAYDLLPSIDVPTLVIAGDRDAMTPRSAAEKMVRAIPGAELMIVPGGTHYVAVEYPELVNLRIEKFFTERGYGSRMSEPDASKRELEGG
jgi:pimeloyl-ACP methyl ester carboxylesterase